MARTTTLQDRIIIWELAEAGNPDPWIANAVGWKVPTVRKWRRRAQQIISLKKFVLFPQANIPTKSWETW